MSATSRRTAAVAQHRIPAWTGIGLAASLPRVVVLDEAVLGHLIALVSWKWQKWVPHGISPTGSIPGSTRAAGRRGSGALAVLRQNIVRLSDSLGSIRDPVAKTLSRG